jgi:predicted nucleic acid-binding protein
MRRIFVDTGAFVALEDADDEHHQAALQFQASLLPRLTRLVTTNFVLDETYTWLRMNIGHAKAVGFGRRVRNSKLLQIQLISDEIEQLAWDIFCRYDDKEFSYTDCTSFAVMQLLSLDTAFAFDRHFRQFGFVCLPETT